MIKCCACNSEHVKKILVINGFDVYKCMNCGLIFTYPMPQDEELQKFYQGFLFEKPDENKIQKQLVIRKKELTDQFKLNQETNSTKKFLDYGGGTGVAYKAAFDLGLNSFYYDIDEKSIEFVKTEFNLDNKFHITNPEIGENYFDYIFCDNVIEHIKDPEYFVNNLYSKLNKGGMLVIKTPNASNFETYFVVIIWLLNYFKRALKENSFKDTFNAVFVHRYWHCDPPRHLYSFSSESLKNVVSKVTKDDKVSVSVDYYHLPFLKYSLGETILNIGNPLKRIVLFIAALPLIVTEFYFLLWHLVLVKLKVISRTGLIVKIEK